MNTLIEIQSELKAPKGNYNSFGKYKYRSCEDILEAAKPLLRKHNAFLILSDSVEAIGGRYYVKATAVYNHDKFSVQVTAFAREEDAKKGMDGSQITGTASSYARKYALNGLFLIDDAKDADTDEYKKQTDPAAAKYDDSALIDAKMATAIRYKLKQTGSDEASFLDYVGATTVEKMTIAQYKKGTAALDKML